MKRAYIAALILSSLVNSSVVRSQTSQPATTEPLSLSSCLATALQNNIDILTSKNNVIAAQSRSSQAKGDYLPKISIENNAFVWSSKDVLNKSTTGTALTVSENIYDGGLREASVRSARYGVTQNEAALARTAQTIVYNVSTAYYEVLRAKHLEQVAQANVKYNEALRDQVRARADVGSAAKVDILPLEAQLANAKVSLLSAENAVRTSTISLQNVMGLAPRVGFDIQEVNDSPVTPTEPLEKNVASALASRPDIAQSKAATGVTGQAVKSATIKLYPRPVITAQYQRSVSGGFTSGGGQVVGGISFDLFDGGANRAARREAKANQANAQEQEQQLLKDIQSQVENAQLNLDNARQRTQASKTSLEAAEANYQAQTSRYNQGLGTTLDLLNAQVQAITAQSASVQAQYDYYIAIAQLDWAVGRPGGNYEN